MTDTLLKPEDTGEIPTRIDDLGDDPTRNLAEYARNTPHFRALPSGELTAELPLYVPGNAVGFDGPQKPPPPLPPIPDDVCPEQGIGDHDCALHGPETEILTVHDSFGTDDDPEPEEDGDEIVFRRGCSGGEPIRSHRTPAAGSRLACRLATKAAVRRAVVWTALVLTAVYLGVDLAAWAVIR